MKARAWLAFGMSGLLLGCGAPTGDSLSVEPASELRSGSTTVLDDVTYLGQGRAQIEGGILVTLKGRLVGKLKASQRYQITATGAGTNTYDVVAVKTIEALVGHAHARTGGVGFTTLKGHEWVITGADAGKLLDVNRSEPPTYDLATTTLYIEVRVPLGSSQRSGELSWRDLQPDVHCSMEEQPSISLDATEIQPDGSAWEPFEWLPSPTGETMPVAYGTCSRSGQQVVCTLRQGDSIYGTASWSLPLASSFKLGLDRTDDAKTVLHFDCSVVTREMQAARSQD